MLFWRTPFGGVSLVAILAASLMLGATVVRVHHVTSPARHQGPPFDFEALMLAVDEVEFQASDGLRLSGWLLQGDPDKPPIVLCHDLGSSKSALTHLAVTLRQAGFTVLLFDFRGHGDSDGGRSSLGLKEKRDVLGAVDYLGGPGTLGRRIGAYGVGMGAYAAMLAAVDRAALKVLVLDGLYPDVSYPLLRGVYGDWDFGVRRLGFLPRAAFTVMSNDSARRSGADQVLNGLLGRELLLLAPADDETLAAEMKRMYEAIPLQREVEGNLVLMPGTQGEGLYGKDLQPYQDRVQEFFVSRLRQH